MDAETWVVLLIVDATDTHVLAEGVAGMVKRRGNYVLAQTPIELTVMQTGMPGFLVVTNLAGQEVRRMNYSELDKRGEELSEGDAIRVKSLSVPIPKP
jgi:hypothetical protein